MSDCILVNGNLMYFPDFGEVGFDFEAQPMYKSIERIKKEVE